MKKIFRVLVFSGVSIALTAYWNKGFIINKVPVIFLEAVIVIAIVNYLVMPLSKIILLPLNLLTFGLMSFIFYALLLHFISTKFDLLTVKSWIFSGISLLGITIPRQNINYLMNLVLSSLSISVIINILEKLL